MLKKNNKGFLLAESLIVSTFVLTVLIYLFFQFNNLMVNHKKSYTYNSVENIYDLGSMKDYLVNQNIMIDLGGSAYKVLYDNGCQNIGSNDVFCNDMAKAMNLEFMIYTDSDMNTIKTHINNNNDLSQDMRDFIEKLDSTKIEGKGRLIAKFKNGNFATIAFDKNNKSQFECSDNLYKFEVVTEGNGLYKDTSEGITRYIYKGDNNVNNYIYIKENNSNVKYRIYSIESDNTIKVIRDDAVISMNFDADDANRRKGGYCTANHCNAWAAMSSFTNGDFNGTVSKDSSMKEYIDNTYSKTLTQSSKIVSKTWNISGTEPNRGIVLANAITDEGQSTWNGKIALLTASEYVRGNSDEANCGSLNLLYGNYSTCKSTNYLYKSSSWWLLSPYYNIRNRVRSVLIANSEGRVYTDFANNSNGVRPSFYLNSGLTFSGEGTENNPYEICD